MTEAKYRSREGKRRWMKKKVVGKEVSEKKSADIYVGEKEGKIVAGGRGINSGTCRGEKKGDRSI